MGMYTEIKPMVDDLVKKGVRLEEAVDEALKKFNLLYSAIEMKLSELGNGKAVAYISFLKRFMNPNGTMHGGIIASVIDQVGALASWSSHWGENQVTLELKINYLRPFTEEESPFRAVGEVIKSGKNTIVTEIKVYGKSGNILAIGLGTWFK
jgi:uncharacterized protein (TIGR00369 family)